MISWRPTSPESKARHSHDGSTCGGPESAWATSSEPARRCLAARDRTKFNDGGILASDPWRITHLELLALADGGEDALMSPSGVVTMASEYAHTGLVWIADALLGEAQATLRLMNRLGDLVD